MRRVLITLLLGVLLAQLGPACGVVNATAMVTTQCCKTKCPAHYAQLPENCCAISANFDKAKPSIAPQPPQVYAIGLLAPVAVQKNADLSLVTYRSPVPPPQRMRVDLFCSRQI